MFDIVVDCIDFLVDGYAVIQVSPVMNAAEHNFK